MFLPAGGRAVSGPAAAVPAAVAVTALCRGLTPRRAIGDVGGPPVDEYGDHASWMPPDPKTDPPRAGT